MSGGSSIGETSRRKRGRPRKVPPPPYEDPPVWYPRVTRSLTPEKVAAAEAAYIRNFLHRWARGEYDEQNQRPMRDSEGNPIRGLTEGNPILIDDDDDRQDVDLGGSQVPPTLGLRPGAFYSLVPMEEDMDIDDADMAQSPHQATVNHTAHDDERPTSDWPPGWGPGIFKLVPISPAEIGLSIPESDVIQIPPRSTLPPPARSTMPAPSPDEDKPVERFADAVGAPGKESVTDRQNPPKHQGKDFADTSAVPPCGCDGSCSRCGLFGCTSSTSDL